MNRFFLNLYEFIRTVVMKFEHIFLGSFKVVTRYEVEGKIDDLGKERHKIVLRYNVFQRIKRIRDSGVPIETVEFESNDNLTLQELGEICDNLSVVESMLAKEEGRASKNKNETVVNLFLLGEKNKYLKAKVICVLALALSAILVMLLSVPVWTVFISVGVYVLFEAKDQVVSYRVSKGFFGTTTSEAMELIKFIRNNIDEIDSGDGGGKKRKILNPLIDDKDKDVLSHGEVPNA